MDSEKLETVKFLDITEEDIKFENRIGHLRRQEYLIGGAGKLKTLVTTIVAAAACWWGYSQFQDSKRNLIYSTRKAKQTFDSMAGELNQEKKIWEFVDN